MILTPSLNRCAPLLDDKKVDSVDLGWVTVTQWLTKMALKLQVSPSRCSLITIGLFTFAASSGFALMVISISLNTWWFSFWPVIPFAQVSYYLISMKYMQHEFSLNEL